MNLFKLSPLLCLLLLPAQAEETGTFAPKFYAFHNGVSFGSAAQNAQTLKELGYDGMSQFYHGGAKLSEQIKAYDQAGLKVLSVYLNVKEKPIAADVVKPLANRGALIELTISGKGPKTVEAVRKTAEMAAGMKIKVVLYPHYGNSVATMPEAMELIRKVNHPNLGVAFNLCHFLKSERAEDLEKVLEKAGTRLFSVSTSGANLGGKGWSDLIKPLDQGDFPQLRLMKALKKLRFKGPVGLQCYGIKGDKRTNLANSMKAWRKVMGEL